MSAGNDPELDAIFSDVPTDTPPSDASATDAPAADVTSTDAAAPTEKGAEDATTPARPERPSGPKKPWWDIYTSMLALTLVAILLGCVFLVIEWSRYNFQTTPPAMPAVGGNTSGG